jgi:hypothetical protein
MTTQQGAQAQDQPSTIHLSARTDPPQLPGKLQDELLYGLTSVMLDTLALSGEPQPYSKVASIVGYHHRDKNFYRQLGRAIREDHAAGNPLRSALVINKQLGYPGQQFFEMARAVGISIGATQAAELAFWRNELWRLTH